MVHKKHEGKRFDKRKGINAPTYERRVTGSCGLFDIAYAGSIVRWGGKNPASDLSRCWRQIKWRGCGNQTEEETRERMEIEGRERWRRSGEGRQQKKQAG